MTESSAYAFAGDLVDEGVDAVLENLQQRAGVTGISPAFVYHAARDVFPHNPSRKVDFADRGAFFFPPERSLYEGLRIQPRVSPAALEHDVLEETCRKASARGLSVHAWTVFLHADRPEENLDCVTQNAFGDRYPTDLCPANPDVRDYVRAVVADVARYDVETIVGESLQYHGLEHGHHHERYFVELGARGRFLLGLCFCEYCLARAGDAGVDGRGVQAAVREELQRVFDAPPPADEPELERDGLAAIADGGLSAYLDARAETVTTLVAEAAEVAAAGGTRLALMDLSGAIKGYASGRPAGAPAADIAWRVSLDLPRLGRVSPELEVLGYAADVDRLRLDLEAYRQQLGEASIGLALRPSSPDCDTPENLAAKVRLARELGVARVDFYHYGFVRLAALDWIREALET